MNLTRPFFHHARTRPDALALIASDRRITYRELAGLVLRAAAELGSRGVRPGDRVGLCLRDSPEHVVVLLAIASLGAVAVPLHWRAALGEIERLAGALEIQLALTEPDAALKLRCQTLPVNADWHRAVASREPLQTLPDDWHAPLVIAATSGSTGAPKFNQATHLQFYCGLVGFLELFALSGRHRYMSTLPLYFSGGRLGLLAHLFRGDCVILHGDLVNARDFVQAAARTEATVGFVVPSLLRELLATGDDQGLLRGLQRLVVGGSPLYAEEKRLALQKLSPNFCEMYGTAETGPISLLQAQDIDAHAGSLGQPHSLIEVEVVGDSGQALPAGESGLLRCRGPSLGTPLDVVGSAPNVGFRDGWYYTGEIASLDELGFIHLAGRATELIMRGGAKIHPAEVEAVLQQHADVLEAAVFGRRGVNNEEEVVACVVGRGPPELSALVAHCRAYLAPTKRPQRIHVLAALPKNASGKIDKQALAKWIAEQD